MKNIDNVNPSYILNFGADSTVTSGWMFFGLTKKNPEKKLICNPSNNFGGPLGMAA
jgi:hypothetical protein